MDNSIPQPVDTNRLKNILAGAKNIMKKVETGDYETGNIDRRALNEDGVKQLQAEGVTRPAMSQVREQNQAEYTERVNNSRMPDIVKKAMLEKPIPQLSGPNHTFNLEDVLDEEVEKPMIHKNIKPTAPKKQLTESFRANPELLSVTKDELAEMVNELVNAKLLEFFIQNHNKRIVDETIKKTISTLIKEGKVK